ncbi:putative phage tail protein [Paenibacillus sp. SYP-B4298]|uniref:putative phage tail protein n=1 Tax=Paenibacillus sp. SYP-B4298 TaxID=2996034 RepID=UPI0022DD1E16|nr:putative phage tail protein [Paenibacillus sp. SYP-B4298]
MSYGTNRYGQLRYGADGGGEDRLDVEGQVDLMAYLPFYYEGVMEMEALQKQLGLSLYVQQRSAQEMMNQRFIASATWGLERWERELGMQSDPSMPYEWRREMVLAKVRGSGTATKAMLIRAAAAFSGGEVEIAEFPEEYRFDIQFVGVMGVPLNMAGLIQFMDEVKPAHLAYSFKYTYTWWNTLTQLSWDQAKSKTWNQLRVYEGE